MRVRFTRLALADLEQIHSYISADNREQASRVVARLLERARLLTDSPYQGRETDEPDVRVMVVSDLRYLIFYRVTADEVHILHIRHTSRRRPSAL
jgi:addiction module RelE/StbE family toxin